MVMFMFMLMLMAYALRALQRSVRHALRRLAGLPGRAGDHLDPLLDKDILRAGTHTAGDNDFRPELGQKYREKTRLMPRIFYKFILHDLTVLHGKDVEALAMPKMSGHHASFACHCYFHIRSLSAAFAAARLKSRSRLL